MKRYKIAHRCIGDFGCDEHPEGDWVLWVDAVRYAEKEAEVYHALSNNQCNCAEKVREIRSKNSMQYGHLPSLADPNPQYWICTKHGYKKL